jgi:hypothetical protein
MVAPFAGCNESSIAKKNQALTPQLLKEPSVFLSGIKLIVASLQARTRNETLHLQKGFFGAKKHIFGRLWWPVRCE